AGTDYRDRADRATGVRDGGPRPLPRDDRRRVRGRSEKKIAAGRGDYRLGGHAAQAGSDGNDGRQGARGAGGGALAGQSARAGQRGGWAGQDQDRYRAPLGVTAARPWSGLSDAALQSDYARSPGRMGSLRTRFFVSA